ncbi:D-alanyl-D-alanine carboxypeptidase family protein [Patescibacteria group bacterium]
MNSLLLSVFLSSALLGSTATDAADSYHSVKVSGEVLAEQGYHLEWEDFSMDLPAGALDATTRFRIRDLGEYGTQGQIPALPKKYRSKLPVYSFFLSQEAADEISVTLSYHGSKNRKRRIYYLAPGSDKWQRLRTIVDRESKTVTSVVPRSYGKLALGTHRYKKESPIKKADYSQFNSAIFSDTATVIDAKSGKFLYRDDAKKVRSIASLSKLVTALVFLESDPDLDKVISYKGKNDRIGADVPLNDGDQLTLKQVLMGALIPSANNMAVTLSQQTDLSAGLFITQMNNRMAEMKLKKTSFVEPTGLNERNVSTAGNIARLARYIFKTYPKIFQEAADTRQYNYTLANSDRGITLYTTNKFDGNGKYDLVAFKTGYLPGSADRTLVTKIQEISTGHEIIVVLLGNPEYNTVFQEAYQLADWAFANWEFHNY